ncbi:MAG: TIGR04283 family arsenosugar biosynthesis glycosyltransferase [Burkholderiales bacterium]
MGREEKLGSRGLSIIVPTLNEAAVVVSFLESLQSLRQEGAELILADGGSRDGTVGLAAPLVDRTLTTPRGRALQMNAGARVAEGEVLLFLHADSCLPHGAARLILEGLRDSGRSWGRFDVRLSGAHPLLRAIEFLMNLRSRLTGIATGDQAMFVTGEAYRAAGGFPEIALMEDIAMSARLKRAGAPLCLDACVVSSSRRWESRGILRTVVLMWRLRLSYFLGADPERLARIYYREA